MSNLKLALKKIEECKKTKSPHLYLAKMGLTEIPKEVFELTWLEALNLNGNNIKELPAEISKLKNLEVLILSNNANFSTVSKSIKRLQNLTDFHIDGTNLLENLDEDGPLKWLFDYFVDNEIEANEEGEDDVLQPIDHNKWDQNSRWWAIEYEDYEEKR